MRLLFYHPDDSLQLGSGHYDKSSVTFQIAESHQGLRVAPTSAADLQPVVRDCDKAVFFAGLNLANQVSDKTIYQPGWHDIIKVDTLNQGRSVPKEARAVCARWALIFFANGSNYTNPDKSSTHSR